MLLEGIGDLATLWRFKGTSSFLLSQAKSIGLSSFYLISNVPPCGNLYLNCLHWKLLAPLHVLVLFLACGCICCASNLLILSNQVCVCWFAHHVRVCSALSLCASCLYVSWLLWEINGTSHFGGVMCFVHLTVPQMCVHEEYHLVLILQAYLVTMWYVFSWEIQILNSPLIISCWILFLPLVKFSLIGITLWGSNMLCILLA